MTHDRLSRPARRPAPALRCVRPRPALRPLALALAAGSLLSLWPATGPRAQAVPPPTLPNGLTVVNGQVKAVTNGKQLTITNSSGSILNWQSFSIGQGHGVTFVQPDASSQVLNRVLGNDPSQILGSLSSNGRVWLLNPNGVLFGQNARIDVAGLVTSTLRLNDVDWLKGQASGLYALAGDSAATIVNQGELRSSFGGRIALVADSVRNEGLVDAPGGQVLLAAGRSVELIDTGTPNLRLKVEAPAGEALNLGTLQAAGGRIDVHAAVINQQGVVRADALGTNAAGEVVLSARHGATLGEASLTSASGGSGGRITVDGGADGTTLVHGRVAATGDAGRGGDVALLGARVGLGDTARVDASGASGGGTVHVGGGERGADPALRNAESVYVGSGAVLSADAGGQGDGGRIVLYGRDTLRAYGSLSARGGAAGGNGGFIETSGGWIDVRPARLDTAAVAGLAGTWLIDPYDIVITDKAGTPGGSGYDTTPGLTFTSSSSGAVIETGRITDALNAGNNVVIATGAGGEEAGNITATGINLIAAPSSAVSLSLQAHGSIFITRSVIETTAAPMSVDLQASLGGNGQVSVSNTSILTGGGSFRASATASDAAGGVSSYAISIADRTLIDTGTGALTLDGSLSTFYYGRAIELSNSSLFGGAVDLRGSATGLQVSEASPVRGVSVNGGNVQGADVTIRGLADGIFGSTGVEAYSSSFGASNTLSIDGTGTGVGVALYYSNASVRPPSGGLELMAKATPLAAGDPAALSITGTSTWSDLTTPVFGNYGVTISGQYGGSLVATNGATISVVGSNGGGGTPALSLSDGLLIDGSTGGNAVLRGNGSAQLNVTAHIGGSLQVLSDDLRLDSGTSLRSDAAGDAIVIGGSSGPNGLSFVNGAGAGALSTPNGRWLIYGQNVASIDAGGLAYDFKQYDARLGEANALTPASGNGLMYAEAPVVTLTANPVTKTYDGNTATGPLSGVAVSGQRDNDVAAVGAVSGVFDTKDAGTGKEVIVTPTTVGFTDTAGKPVLGYAVSSTLTGTITPKAVTYAGLAAADKVYDGNRTASVSAGPLTGLVGSESLTLSLSGQFDTKDAGTGKTVSVGATLGNGSGGGLASNYVLAPTTPTTTTAAITPKLITVGVTASDKTYDGGTATSVTLGGGDGPVAGETIGIGAVGRFDTKDVGSGKTVTVDLSLADGTGPNAGLASNYRIAPTVTTQAAITPRALTVTADDASKVYGTTLTFAGTEFTSSGLVEGERIDRVTLTSAGAAPTASVAGGP
ncbi:YDG domain-containing protein, partial [Piscinibacter sakaiensis]|uniref:YDG domain-containing protein n=1 Tax=Piscinibacter sakaiensis TaxID=1547922 RepID=UPI0009E97ADD